MEFDQVIQNRRSIRKFHQQAVETEKITAILDLRKVMPIGEKPSTMEVHGTYRR